MQPGKRATRNEAIKQFIIAQVGTHPSSIAKLTRQHFGMSRQAANNHIDRLVEEGVLASSGAGKGRQYTLAGAPAVGPLEKTFLFSLTDPLDEDVVWRDHIKPLLQDLPKTVVDLWHYCVTEMVNNAIDHAGGTRLTVFFAKTTTHVEIWIDDDGEGIFNKIQRVFQLPDPRQALFELKKGKLTTDKARHSGQGIFFTSRMCDEFAILSDSLIFLHDDKNQDDWLSKHERTAIRGTAVFLQIANTTTRTAKGVHDQYSADDSYQFAKTVIPVRMASDGEGLVSRSQAKRLLIRLDKFETVLLDFSGVEEIGQGFADEIFRVWAKQHPGVRIFPLNANAAVSNMISRALLTRDEMDD